MEWQAPAVVLGTRPHGEAALVVQLLTEPHGRHPGLAKGGASRAQAPLWQPGNLVEARWVGRLPEQLGAVSGEMVHPAAALAMADPLALALLNAACALAEAALPERAPHPRAFHGLVGVLGRLAGGPQGAVAEYVRWEATLLEELGYGLALGACALSGDTEDLAYVSPRTGRAVSAAAAGDWAGRLLPLPGFLLRTAEPPGANAPSGPEEWLAGLRLTGHFLARDALGHQHRPLPAARAMLLDRLAALTHAG
jgi:DNA repair protein RecO (recombination protein O)